MKHRTRNRLGQYASPSAVALAHEAHPTNGTTRQVPVGSALQQITLDSIHHYHAKRIIGIFNPHEVGLKQFRQMLCHYMVQFGMAIRRSALINLKWKIESDDPEIKAFFEKLYDEHFRSLAIAMSQAIALGYVVIEKVFQVGPFEIEIPATGEGAVKGETQEITMPVAWTIRRWKNIRQETIKLLVEDDEWAGVEQEQRNRGAPVRVGPERVILWSYRAEDEYGLLTGSPLLRAVYEPWFENITTTLFANRYFERKGEGSWKARAGASVTKEGGKKQDGFKLMEDGMEHLRANGIVVLPAELDENGQNFLFDVELLNDDKRGDMFQNRIDATERNILRGVLVTDKAATSGDGEGSMAQATVHQEVMEGPLETDVAEGVDVMNNQVTDPLGKWNFGEERYEKSRTRLTSAGIASRTKEIFNEVLGRLMEADEIEAQTGEVVSVKDLIDVKGILDEIGIPMKSPEDMKALAEQKARARAEMEKRFADAAGGGGDDDEKAIADRLVRSGADPDDDS